MRLETRAVHAGQRIDASTGAVAPPIHPSTTFERDPDGGYPRGYLYARLGNPNRDALEQCLAELEGGGAAAAFASGMAATAAIFQALAPGDHVIISNDVYHGTARLVREQMVPWGLQATFVDMADLGELRRAVRPTTRLVWVETPSNPMLRVTDIAGVAEIVRETRALTACDNTWATPVLQRPLELGADLVMHSTTKYLSGHSDITGGAVVARQSEGFFERVRKVQVDAGAVPAPFDCWLLLRSIRSLPYRVRAHADHAFRVATFLSEHPRVESVHYPGLPKHPGHDIAARQMAAFGGMASVQVKGGREAALAVAARVKLFTRATSLGGVESLIEHRASVEGPKTRTPDNLLRLSIGLEHPDDLIEDLSQALARAPRG
jgi:cystathionine gamma-synthase